MSRNKETDKRLHDLKSVHSNFKQVLQLLRSEHNFSEEERAEVLKELDNSLKTFSNEIQELEENWQDAHKLEVVGS